MLDSQLRAIESTEYEQRLRQIEQRLKELDRDRADTNLRESIEHLSNKLRLGVAEAPVQRPGGSRKLKLG